MKNQQKTYWPLTWLLSPQRGRFDSWAALALALLVLGGMRGYLFHEQYQDITAREKDRLRGQALVIAKNLERQLLGVNNALRGCLTEMPHWRREGWPQVSQHLRTLCSAMPGVRTLQITNEQGQVLASNQQKLLGMNFSYREYFQRTKLEADPARMHVSPPYISVLGAKSINLALMIPDEQGGFGGVISATLDPEYFSTLMTSVLYAPDMWTAMAHGDGVLFLFLPQRPGLFGKNLAKPGSLFTRHMQSGQDESVMIGTALATGDERLAVVKTVSPPSVNMDTPLVFTITRDYQALHAGWWAELKTQSAIYLMLVFFCCAGLWAYRGGQKMLAAREADSARAVRAKEKFLRTITDNIPAMVSYWTKDQRCAFANAAYREWYGLAESELDGLSARELLGESLYNESQAHIQAALNGEIQQLERVMYSKDNIPRHAMVHYIPDFEEGQVRGFLAVLVDITELKDTQHQLEALVMELNILARTDPLTGASNRREFYSQAQREFDRCKRFATPLTFLMLDVDHFKSINDVYGHDSGDEVLKILAERCRQVLRRIDLFCRLGGEEFGVLLVNTDLTSARLVAEKLRREMASLVIHHNGQDIRFTISVGVVLYQGDIGQSVEDLMRQADVALYQAKDSGRDRVCVFDEPC